MTTGEQKLLEILKDPATYSGTGQSPYSVVSDWYSKQQDEFNSKIGDSMASAINNAINSNWKGLTSGQSVDVGNGYKMQVVEVVNNGTGWNHYQLINPSGATIYDTTNRGDFRNLSRYAAGAEQGYLVGISRWDTLSGAFSKVAKDAGFTTTDLSKWKTTAYDDWRKIQDAGLKDYGTFINNAGQKTVATSLDMLKSFKTLGFPQVSPGKDSLTADEQKQMDTVKAPAPEFQRNDLQLIADGKATTVDEANTMINQANPNFNAGPVTVTPNPTVQQPSAPAEDPLVWVQKGVNKLQMTKSAADALVAKGEGTIIDAPSQEEITQPTAPVTTVPPVATTPAATPESKSTAPDIKSTAIYTQNPPWNPGIMYSGVQPPTGTKWAFTESGERVAVPNSTTLTDPGTLAATLYGPNNTKKVVKTGSTQASDLQSQGWGLTSGSYKAPTTPEAPVAPPVVPQPTTPTIEPPTSSLPAKYVYKSNGNYVDQDGNYLGTMAQVSAAVSAGAKDYGDNPPAGVTAPNQTLAPQPAQPVTQPINSPPTAPTTQPVTTPTTTTPTETTPTPNSNIDTFIPFRTGLTDAQKQSIIALTNKPSSSWSDTDRSNWNWATNSAPLPTTTPVASPTVPTTPVAPAVGGDTMIPFRDGLSDAQKQSIIDLYNKPPEQWSGTDTLNWKWATNNAPAPTAPVAPTAPSAPTAPAAGSDTLIPFRDGLNDSQRQSIVDLYNKPAADWSETDKLNWNWATNSAPMPTAPTAPVVPETEGDLNYDGISADALAIIKRYDPDQQKVLIDQYNAIALANTLKGQEAAKALDEAVKTADPWWRSQLLMARDEVTNALASNEQDVLSSIGQYQTKINQINQDLAYGRETLTLDQQAQMSDLLRTYKANLTDLSQQAAEQGLAFSSPRKLAEQRLSEANQSQAQALSSAAAKSLRELETTGLRGIQTAEQGIQDTTRQGAEAATSIWRKAEGAMGTANLPTGAPSLGTQATPVVGSLEDQRQQKILDLQNTLINQQDPFKFTT